MYETHYILGLISMIVHIDLNKDTVTVGRVGQVHTVGRVGQFTQVDESMSNGTFLQDVISHHFIIKYCSTSSTI